MSHCQIGNKIKNVSENLCIPENMAGDHSFGIPLVILWWLGSCLFCFPSLSSDGCPQPPPPPHPPIPRIDSWAFCFSQPILKLLSPGRLFKSSSSGTFALKFFMKSAYSNLVSTKIAIYFFQTTHRSLCRKAHSLINVHFPAVTCRQFGKELLSSTLWSWKVLLIL